MTHIEKFNVSGKTYFKLVHNIREDDKISHKSKYLGKTIPKKSELAKIEKEFFEQIDGKRYKYLSSK